MTPSAELKARIVSGVVLGAAVLFITWWNPLSFALLCVLGGAILLREWWTLTKNRSRLFIPLGLVYIGGAVATLIYLRYLSVDFMFCFLAFVWAGDIAAYAVGKAVGRHKIAPRISPGKSWEGLVGAALAISALIFIVQPINPQWLALIYGTVIATVSIAGDLFESSLKRRAGVKDSGTLIPGHGGLFDRTDALVACAFCMGIVLVTASSLLLSHLPTQTD